MNFVERIKLFFMGTRSSEATQIPEEFKPFLQMVENTREVEYSCEEVYQILDQYTELVFQGEDAAKLMPLVEQHIEMCPDCREEFEALLKILQASAT